MFNIKLAKQHMLSVEGKRSRVYKDIKGIKTIGIGFNLEREDAPQIINRINANYEKICLGMEELTDDQIDQLLEITINEAIDIARKKLQPHVFDNLNENQQIAIVSLVFNSPSLLGPDITQALNTGNHTRVGCEILHRSNKNKNPSIQTRREKECNLYFLPVDKQNVSQFSLSTFFSKPNIEVSQEGNKTYLSHPDSKISGGIAISTAGLSLFVKLSLASEAALLTAGAVLGVGGVGLLGYVVYLLYNSKPQPANREMQIKETSDKALNYLYRASVSTNIKSSWRDFNKGSKYVIEWRNMLKQADLAPSLDAEITIRYQMKFAHRNHAELHTHKAAKLKRKNKFHQAQHEIQKAERHRKIVAALEKEQIELQNLKDLVTAPLENENNNQYKVENLPIESQKNFMHADSDNEDSKTAPNNPSLNCCLDGSDSDKSDDENIIDKDLTQSKSQCEADRKKLAEIEEEILKRLLGKISGTQESTNKSEQEIEEIQKGIATVREKTQEILDFIKDKNLIQTASVTEATIDNLSEIEGEIFEILDNISETLPLKMVEEILEMLNDMSRMQEETKKLAQESENRKKELDNIKKEFNEMQENIAKLEKELEEAQKMVKSRESKQLPNEKTATKEKNMELQAKKPDFKLIGVAPPLPSENIVKPTSDRDWKMLAAASVIGLVAVGLFGRPEILESVGTSILDGNTTNRLINRRLSNRLFEKTSGAALNYMAYRH